MSRPDSPNARLLRGSEVCSLLVIGKTTLKRWRDDSLISAVPLPNGEYRYPSTEPAIERALRALGRPL